MRQQRFLSWLLTLCLLLGMFSFPAYAEGNTTTTTISDDGTAEKTGTMTVTLVIPKKTPAATDLTYTAPSDLTYSSSDKAATVSAASGVTGLGEITVKYYSDAARTTEAAPKNVGTYYVGATVAEGDQYAASASVLYDNSWTFTITASTPSAPAAPTMASATKNSITLNAVSGCEYSKDGATYQDSTEFTGLMPGTEYTFYQRVKATANTNASAASSASFTTEADTYAMTITLVIKPAQTITASDVTATYGDTGKSVSGTTSGDGAISYSVKSGDAVTVNPTTGALTIVKAGSAVITVTAAETATYAQATKDVNVTVNTKAMTVSAENVNVTVDGQSHGITVNVTDPATGYTIKYGTEAGSYTLDASPTQTEAGTKTVYYQVTADNYTTYTGSATVTVNAHVHNWSYTASGATVTATCGNTDGGHSGDVSVTLTINATGGTYTGSAYTGASLDATAWTAAGLAAPTIEYAGRGSTSYTKSTTAPTNVGDYTASVTVEGQTAGVDFTIGKASITPSVSLDGWTYGEAANAPSVTGNTDNGAVTFTYAIKGSTDFSATVPTNAGEYTVKATVAATNNYNGGEATADFTIAKATVTVTAEAKSKTYGEATDPTLTYTCSDLVSGDSFTGALTRETGENAGTYAIGQGTLTAGDNYTISYTGANFTINKAAITITADDKSSKYGEDIAELTYQVGGAYKTGDELGVTVNTTATKTSDVGEYPITVSWNENANYTATVTSGKYTITKTGLTVNATGYTGAYDGAAHGITVDVGSSGATVYYAETELTAANYNTAGSTTAPTYTDAGDYTVYFYVVTSNYNPDIVSGSKTVSISKATMTKDDLTEAQKPTAKTDLIADNTDQALLTAPEALPEGYTKIQYSIDNGTTWTDAIPTGKDPGDYTVLTKYIGDKNHADFEGAAVTASIKTLTVTFEVNGGSAVAAQGVIKGEKAAKPADPTKAGNAFDGWFQDATFSVAFDFDTPITADMTLYAKWTPNDYSFQTITGTTTDASHSWTKGSGKDVVITVKLTTEPDNSFAHFTDVQIDGKTLTRDTDYTAREGSTIVTLKAATLQKLSTGAHTVTIVFDNGTVDVRLTVKPNPSSPATGDTRTTGLWATLTILSGLGIGGVTVFGKKRRKSIGQ